MFCFMFDNDYSISFIIGGSIITLVGLCLLLMIILIKKRYKAYIEHPRYILIY